MIGLTIEDIRVGDTAKVVRRVDDGDIASFVDAVGDYNPVHADREYAATTMFKEPIAPGIWTAGLISGVIGTRLPGPGAIYLSQELKFLKPVFFGDVITARVEVLEVLRARNRIRLKTVCSNQRGEEVLTGEAHVGDDGASGSDGGSMPESGEGRAIHAPRRASRPHPHRALAGSGEAGGE